MRTPSIVLILAIVTISMGCKKSETAPAATTRAAPPAAGSGAATPQSENMLRGRVVLAGQPEKAVEGAKVMGEYVSDGKTRMAVSDAAGKFEVPAAEEDVEFLVMTKDEKLGTIVRVKPGDQDVTIAVGPTASAHGRLVDADGKPVAGLRITYGIMTMSPEELPSPIAGGRPVRLITAAMGGFVQSSSDGTFDATGLVPGHEYVFSLASRSFMIVLRPVKPDSGGPIDLGDVHATQRPPRHGATEFRRYPRVDVLATQPSSGQVEPGPSMGGKAPEAAESVARLQPDEVAAQEVAVAEIKACGGIVERNGDAPDGAVVSVVFASEDTAKMTMDDGLKHIGALKRLRTLVVRHCDDITDAGVAHFKDLKTLQVLVLENGRITDAGLEYLKGLSHLRKLTLSFTSVTDAGVKKLQAALPDCKIYR